MFVKAQQTGMGFYKPDDEESVADTNQDAIMRESDKIAEVRIKMED